MMRIAILLAAVALTACGRSEPEVDARNATVGEVAEQVREATRDSNFIRPGKWLSQVTFQEIDAPGMPPAVREQMRGMMAKNDSYESCLTPEEVKRPKEDFFGADKSCRYEHFTMGGGKIDIRMQCKGEGGTQETTMTGSYTPTTYSMDMASNATGGEQSGMTMKMHVDAKRVGECTGKEG